VYPALTAAEVRLQDPAVCEKPEPEKVIVDPTEPEVELNVTVGPLTVNVTAIDGDPVVSAKVME
jgi:hypothetical protein